MLIIVSIIPAGKYTKLSIASHMQRAVAEAWNETWKINLVEAMQQILMSI